MILHGTIRNDDVLRNKRFNVGTMLQQCRNAVLRWKSLLRIVPCNINFEQRRRGRLQKRYLKSNVVLLQNLSRLFHFVQFFKCWHFFWSWILKGWKRSLGKKKRKLLSFFHVIQKRWNLTLSRCSRAVTAKKCTKKCDSGAKLLFCQSKPIALIFCRFRWRRRRRR